MHHQELPIKTILGWKMLSNSGLHRTGLSPGRCGQLRFWAPSAPRCAIVTGAAALDQVGRAAPRAPMRIESFTACHGRHAIGHAVRRCDAAAGGPGISGTRYL